MNGELKIGEEKLPDITCHAGTSFAISSPSPIFPPIEESKLEDELLSSRDNIQQIFAVFRQDERKI